MDTPSLPGNVSILRNRGGWLLKGVCVLQKINCPWCVEGRIYYLALEGGHAEVRRLSLYKKYTCGSLVLTTAYEYGGMHGNLEGK